MDIGKKLRELRKQNDLTLEDLASRSEYCNTGGHSGSTWK